MRRQRRRDEEAERQERRAVREKQRRGRRRHRREDAAAGRSETHDGSRSIRQKKRRRPTAQEDAYREARKRANAKIGFITHFICYIAVLALILVSSGSIRATVIVSLSWGIGIAVHYFAAVVAPGLRHRMIEDEVGRNVARGVTRERRAAENARSKTCPRRSPTRSATP